MSRESAFTTAGGVPAATVEQPYENEETRALVALVADAAELLRSRGEAAFDDFRVSGSRWREGESYIFVLDPQGNMLVHPDAALAGRNDLDLQDINGKPIIRGLIDAAMVRPDEPEGWYHYQWPVPGGLLPRWKSSYVRLVSTPSGRRLIVGAGMYNDRMERAFVEDAVRRAVAELGRNGKSAFGTLRDPKGPYIAKDAYVFVMDMAGIELVNPAFPTLEGRNLLDLTDAQGKHLNREMIELVRSRGSGWIDYMWPKPGESLSTQKSAYVSAASAAGTAVVVGCGVYLAEAPREPEGAAKITAPELMRLVREAAARLEERGQDAYAELRRKDSKWFQDERYFFVIGTDGTRAFHATEPETEGENWLDATDARGRPYARMMLDVGTSASGEGWVHYMYPRPGEIFPAWKSAFIKRVRFPSGEHYVVGCGVYNMRMDQAFVEDVVNRAAVLVEEQGRDAFPQLRDRKGPFVFMDTYVFVESPDGTELVNAGQPWLEGRNLMDLKDLQGRTVVREEIAAALKESSAWIELDWYRPGDNVPARKLTYVRKAQAGPDTFIVGSGIYTE